MKIGLSGCLFLIFLTLKLTHFINWSWWWVTAPLWIPVVFAIVLFTVGALLLAVADRG
jgi:hypothetical protein